MTTVELNSPWRRTLQNKRHQELRTDAELAGLVELQRVHHRQESRILTWKKKIRQPNKISLDLINRIIVERIWMRRFVFPMLCKTNPELRSKRLPARSKKAQKNCANSICEDLAHGVFFLAEKADRIYSKWRPRFWYYLVRRAEVLMCQKGRGNVCIMRVFLVSEKLRAIFNA